MLRHLASHSDRASPSLRLEVNHTLQAGHLLLVNSHHIRHDSVFPRGHLLGNIDTVRHGHGAVQRALEIDAGNLVAEVGRLVDQGDQAIFDGQGNFGTGLDGLAEDTRGGYVEA